MIAIYEWTVYVLPYVIWVQFRIWFGGIWFEITIIYGTTYDLSVQLILYMISYMIPYMIGRPYMVWDQTIYGLTEPYMVLNVFGIWPIFKPYMESHKFKLHDHIRPTYDHMWTVYDLKSKSIYDLKTGIWRPYMVWSAYESIYGRFFRWDVVLQQPRLFVCLWICEVPMLSHIISAARPQLHFV